MHFFCRLLCQIIQALVHPGPDADALFSAAVVQYLNPQRRFRIAFSANPDPRWHNPRRGRYTMDIGHGPLDHHQLADPRSTCAFTLTLEHFAAHGTPSQRNQSRNLLHSIAPAVLRQDRTGRIMTAQDDTLARLFTFPRVLTDCVYAQSNDEQSYHLLAPYIHGVFDHALVLEEIEEELRAGDDPAEIATTMMMLANSLRTYLQRERLSFPRGVLDWRDLLNYAIEQGSPSATAIDTIMTPVVARYRTTGRITEQIDPIAHVLSLPHMLRCGSLHNGDHDALLHALFAARVADYEAQHHPERMLEHASVVVGATGRVARVQTTLTKGSYPNGYHLEHAIFGRYPEIQLLVQDVQWRNSDGSLATYLRSIVRRPQSALVVPDYLNAILSHVPPVVCADLQRWHQERWVCLIGGLKNEEKDDGPDNWATWVLQALDAVMTNRGAL